MGDIVTLTKSQSVRDSRLADLEKLSKELDGLGAGMLLARARQLLTDSLLRATGIAGNCLNDALAMARFLDERALVDLIAEAQGITRERSGGVKRSSVISINPKSLLD